MPVFCAYFKPLSGNIKKEKRLRIFNIFNGYFQIEVAFLKIIKPENQVFRC